MKCPLVLWLGLFLAGVCSAQSPGPEDPLSSELEREAPHLTAMLRATQAQRQKEVSEQNRRRVALRASVSQPGRAAATADPARVASRALPLSPDPFRQSTLIALFSLLALGLATRRFAPQIAEFVEENLTPRMRLPAPVNARGRVHALPEESGQPEDDLDFPGTINDPARQVLLFPRGDSLAAPLQTTFPQSRKEACPAEPPKREESLLSDTDRADAEAFLQEQAPAKSVLGFLASAPRLVAELRARLREVVEAAEPTARRHLLLDLHHRAESLTCKASRVALPPIAQLSSALESLLKKLLENPEHANPSTLNTLAHALDLLQDLAVPGLDPSLASDPPPRMLVVDDDPLARRAISYALQVAFDKPDSAANGQAALVLASQAPYEVIFADIQMPGLDGFTLCSKSPRDRPQQSHPRRLRHLPFRRGVARAGRPLRRR